jgi:hypothetical protein
VGLSTYAIARLMAASVGQALAAASPQYLALLTDSADGSGDGAALSEVTYGGYQRVAIDAVTGWSADDSGTFLTNAADVTLAPCTSGAGQVAGWALCDSLTGGHYSWSGLTPIMIIDIDDPEPKIPEGALLLNLSSGP